MAFNSPSDDAHAVVGRLDMRRDLARQRGVVEIRMKVRQHRALRPDPLADTSPARLLPVGVPFVSVNGSEDRIAPPLLGDGLTRKAMEAGDTASLIVVPATGHVELVAPDTEAFRIQADVLASFVGLTPAAD